MSTDGRVVGVALRPSDPWRKCWRCGVEYMGVSACPECTTENAVDTREGQQGGLDAWLDALACMALAQ
jgi:hypothetical protein